MKKLLLFTDLDGTLLDHQSYDWLPAKPAIERLQQLDIPLIFNTSKTLAELMLFTEQLNIRQPMIAENGSIAAIPNSYFPSDNGTADDYQHHIFGSGYSSIVKVLQGLREQHGFLFSSFTDLGIDGVVKETGLSRSQATLACQRLASEPMVWQDSQANLDKLTRLLNQQGLSLTKGGRFYHVMNPVTKGSAMAWMLSRFQDASPDCQWVTVALGDNDNDRPMLEFADHAVLIHNQHTSSPDFSHIHNLIRPQQTGPRGWNDAVNQLIDLYQ